MSRFPVTPSLSAAFLLTTSVLVSGFSAGSGGVLHNGDWIASVFARNGTTVRLLRDASN